MACISGNAFQNVNFGCETNRVDGYIIVALNIIGRVVDSLICINLAPTIEKISFVGIFIVVITIGQHDKDFLCS